MERSIPSAEAVEVLANKFQLSTEDRNELLASGSRETRFANRMGWARTALKKAGLVDGDANVSFPNLTDRGRALLSEKPENAERQVSSSLSGILVCYVELRKIKPKLRHYRLQLKRPPSGFRNSAAGAPRGRLLSASTRG